MFRRITSLTGLVALTVLGSLLSAGPAAAQYQYQSDPTKTTVPYFPTVVCYDWSGLGSLYATYAWGTMLIQRNSAAARGDGDYVGPYDLPADSKRQTTLATLRRYGGGLDWPIGLRNMLPRDEGDVRERMDSTVELLLHQPASERPNAELVVELSTNLEKVCKRFASYMADSTMTAEQERDARHFLRKVQDAIRLLDDRPKLATTGSK